MAKPFLQSKKALGKKPSAKPFSNEKALGKKPFAQPLEIKRIDLLVHPFFDKREGMAIYYNQAQSKKIFKIWKGHIDEAAKDPNRLLLFIPVETGKQNPWLSQARELQNYASEKLGKRYGLFLQEGKEIVFRDRKNKPFKTLKGFLGAYNSYADISKIKTRGLGELDNACIFECLARLNEKIGMANPIPYRNGQSTVLARKSVGSYPIWQLSEMAKTQKGREKIRELAQKRAKERVWKAESSAELRGIKGLDFRARPRKRIK
jgi:hypothetical protein